MLFTTSLKLSKKFAEIGVKTESEFRWGKAIPTGKYVLDTSGMVLQNQHYFAGDGYPAYTLSDLPAVLREVGEIKGWDKKLQEINSGRLDWIKENLDVFDYQDLFLDFCRTFAENPTQQGWDKAEEELEKII